MSDISNMMFPKVLVLLIIILIIPQEIPVLHKD